MYIAIENGPLKIKLPQDIFTGVKWMKLVFVLLEIKWKLFDRSSLITGHYLHIRRIDWITL